MLSVSDIQKISALARLRLSEAEIRQYRRELDSIVSYIDQLGLAKAPARSAATKAATSALRSDKAEAWSVEERDAALGQFPDKQGRQLKVRRILA